MEQRDFFDAENETDICVSLFSREDFKQKIQEYLHDDKMDVLNFVSSRDILNAADDPGFAEKISKDSVLLPGELSLFSKEKLKEIKKTHIVDYRGLKDILVEKHDGIHSVYLVGDDKKRIEKFMKCVNFCNPELDIAGAYFVDPEVSEELKLSDELIVNEINGADTDIVIVMMGEPRQAEWIEANRTIVHSKICLGIGQVADQFIKRYKQEPGFFVFFRLQKLYHKLICHDTLTQNFRRRIFFRKMGKPKKKEES